MLVAHRNVPATLMFAWVVAEVHMADSLDTLADVFNHGMAIVCVLHFYFSLCEISGHCTVPATIRGVTVTRILF